MASSPVKLTLRLDGALVERAKRHARAQGTSVSGLVADFFAVLDREPEQIREAPPVQRLRGLLRGAPVEEADYRAHLEAKHR
jgi:hypothetical protein